MAVVQRCDAVATDSLATTSTMIELESKQGMVSGENNAAAPRREGCAHQRKDFCRITTVWISKRHYSRGKITGVQSVAGCYGVDSFRSRWRKRAFIDAFGVADAQILLRAAQRNAQSRW